MKIIMMEGMDKELAALANAKSVFDVVRKKYVAATPEEKVRQLMIHYLIEHKKFPRSLLGVEVPLTLNRLKKRCDILAYKSNFPVLIAECKSPAVRIDQSVFEQAARYNLSLKVPYLLVANGVIAMCCKLDLQKGEFEFLEDIPEYGEMVV